MCDEICGQAVDSLRLPKGWRASVRNAVLNVVGVVRVSMLAGREALITNGDVKDARIHQSESEVAMLREELRINGARMKRVQSHRRPQYVATERMAILQLRAMRSWNKAETARHFFVTDDTIRSWIRRVDDDTLVQTQTPVNRFPDFVRYAIQQIKLFCPRLGKVKIADIMARALVGLKRERPLFKAVHGIRPFQESTEIRRVAAALDRVMAAEIRAIREARSGRRNPLRVHKCRDRLRDLKGDHNEMPLWKLSHVLLDEMVTHWRNHLTTSV